MPKTIARDLLRVAAFIPDVSPIIEKVIERAWWWADDIFVVTPEPITLDAETYLTGFWRSINECWHVFENQLDLQEGDYVVFLQPTEILVNADALRPAIRYNPDKKLGFVKYYMVNPYEYSTYIQPIRVLTAYPYKSGGIFNTFTSDTRGPDYVERLPSTSVNATDILDYVFADPTTRGDMANLLGESRLENVHNMSRQEWEKGGLL